MLARPSVRARTTRRDIRVSLAHLKAHRRRQPLIHVHTTPVAERSLVAFMFSIDIEQAIRLSSTRIYP